MADEQAVTPLAVGDALLGDALVGDVGEVMIDDAVIADFRNAHGDLDEIEQQLAQIRERQKSFMETSSTTKKGSLDQLDLRTLIELADDDDEEFDRRFDQFTATDSNGDDRARRWMEAHS